MRDPESSFSDDDDVSGTFEGVAFTVAEGTSLEVLEEHFNEENTHIETKISWCKPGYTTCCSGVLTLDPKPNGHYTVLYISLPTKREKKSDYCFGTGSSICGCTGIIDVDDRVPENFARLTVLHHECDKPVKITFQFTYSMIA